MSKISVIGMGYVGLVGATCLASMGYDVIGVDIDNLKINKLKNSMLPIVEPNLDELFKKNIKKLIFSNNIIDAIKESEVCMVCVGTPSYKDGRVDTSSIKLSAQQIGQALKEKQDYCTVVYRSTIPPGTSKSLVLPVIENISNKKRGVDFGYAFNPEFLREGSAIEDFFHPPKTVIGSEDDRAYDLLLNLYSTVGGEKINLPIIEAEMIKYVDNVWHAIKVSFANEVGRFAKKNNADGKVIMDVFCKDRKLNLSPYYLKPGFAFGGSCLPKDVKGFTTIANQMEVDIPLISSIMKSNQSHITKASDLIESVVPEHENIVIVGISFKPYTDDVRESPAVYLAKELKERGYDILYYDPIVKSEDVKRYFGEEFIDISDNKFLNSADDIFSHKNIVLTGSYKDMPANHEIYRGKHIFDLNGIFYKNEKIKKESDYHGICW